MVHCGKANPRKAGVSSQQGQQSLGFPGCGGRQSRSGRASQVSAPAAAPNASSTHCRALWGGQTGSGWFDGALVHPGGRVRVVLPPPWHRLWPGPAAGDARDGETAAPALAGLRSQPPARLRAVNRRGSRSQAGSPSSPACDLLLGPCGIGEDTLQLKNAVRKDAPCVN